MMMTVAVLLAAGVLMSMNVGGTLLRRGRKLLEEMMHPMWCGSGEKKTKHGGDAKV